VRAVQRHLLVTLRVLHVLDHSVPLQSGYAFRTLALLREQRAMGWETFQLTTPKHYAPGPDEEEVAGLHFFRTRMQPALLARLPVVDNYGVVRSTSRRMAALLERVRPDIIHAHSPCLNGLSALTVGRAHDIPVVYEMRASWEDAAVDHGTTREGSLRYKLSRALETHVLKRADAITTICNGLAGDIVSRGITRDRITIIPNAVDIEDFEVIEQPDEALRRELNIGAGPVLGFVGSFYGYEGLDLLVRAAPQILRAHPQAHVVLVGGGPAEGELKRIVAELGIGDRVHFTGRVPHDQVRRYYAAIDVLVYPRKSMRLTELVTPLKPLESMSLGRLFVASDVGGHRELIPEHLRPYVFRAGDVGDLARVTLQLLAERERWPALARAARDYVGEQCTWKLSAARYRNVYAGVARLKGARSDHGVSAL
jgi:PEP-CTERM/exosortase A-associated glycosyltransferase